VVAKETFVLLILHQLATYLRAGNASAGQEDEEDKDKVENAEKEYQPRYYQ